MCGIAGYFGEREIDQRRLDSCLRLMRRRGPDHAAMQCLTNETGRRAYLLHTRLKIIDLDERANQPFRVGSKSMIYNGEIYNYIEIRRDLEQQGVEFSTTSDTEVLLKKIVQSGIQAVDVFEGMWSFAIYDENTGSLLLSRDRFGEKPLFLYQDESGMFFGSEVKFISELLGRPLSINYQQIHRYLVNGYKALYKQQDTFFKGLSELPAGSFMEIDPSGKEKVQRYWNPTSRPDDSMSYVEAVEGARDRLIRSVKLRLRADVPLAFCMSGGVDSNALISIAKNVFDYDVHGFTIANSDTRYEEQEMVECAVEELGIRHTSISVDTDGFLPKMRLLVRQHDAPVYTITYFAHWLLMESIASHGYRISISGTAADELFTGYYDHHLAYLYEVRNDAPLYSKSVKAWNDHIRPIVRNPFLSNPDLFLLDPDVRNHIYLNADEFSKYLKNDWREPFREKSFTSSLLRNRMMNEMFHEAVPVILHEDDLNAMYFSVENRSPFLDRSLFDFCFTMPSKYLIRDGMAKAVLRDSMQGIMPEAVRLNRRKVGFNAPIFSFLDVTKPDVREALLDKSSIFDYVHRHKIEDLIQKVSLPNSESKFLFYFLSTKLFLEEFAC